MGEATRPGANEQTVRVSYEGKRKRREYQYTERLGEKECRHLYFYSGGLGTIHWAPAGLVYVH